jgi:hypothetical protein
MRSDSRAGVDDLRGQGVEVVNCLDVSDLGQDAVNEAEIGFGDPDDCCDCNSLDDPVVGGRRLMIEA